VLILASFWVHSSLRVAAITAPTSHAISSGMSMVANLSSVSLLACGGGRPIGRRSHTYKSSSLLLLEGGGGDGDTACQNKVASGDEESSGHEKPEVASGDEEASGHD